MTPPGPRFQPGDLVTWTEQFTGRECRGQVRGVREDMPLEPWYRVAVITPEGVITQWPLRSVAERRLQAADGPRPVLLPPAPARPPAVQGAAKYKIGDPVTWLEGPHRRERRGVVETIWHERGFGHTYNVRSVLEDGQPGKQVRQFAEAELAAPKEPEAEVLPLDEVARRLAELRDKLRR